MNLIWIKPCESCLMIWIHSHLRVAKKKWTDWSSICRICWSPMNWKIVQIISTWLHFKIYIKVITIYSDLWLSHCKFFLSFVQIFIFLMASFILICLWRKYSEFLKNRVQGLRFKATSTMTDETINDAINWNLIPKRIDSN